VDGQDGVARVVLLVEQGPQLRLLEVGLEPGHGRIEVGLDALAFGGELGQDLDLLFMAEDALEELELLLQELLLLLERLGGLLVLPNLGRGQAGVQELELGRLVIEVKENLGPLRLWRTGRTGGSSGLRRSGRQASWGTRSLKGQSWTIW
jgi:hypothetical protein